MKWQFLFFGLVIMFSTAGATMKFMENDHGCDTPCTVRLPKNTAEDDIRYNYLSNHKFKVWIAGNH